MHNAYGHGGVSVQHGRRTLPVRKLEYALKFVGLTQP